MLLAFDEVPKFDNLGFVNWVFIFSYFDSKSVGLSLKRFSKVMIAVLWYNLIWELMTWTVWNDSAELKFIILDEFLNILFNIIIFY